MTHPGQQEIEALASICPLRLASRESDLLCPKGAGWGLSERLALGFTGAVACVGTECLTVLKLQAAPAAAREVRQGSHSRMERMEFRS